MCAKDLVFSSQEMQTARENLSFEVALLVSLLMHAASIVCFEQREALGRFSLFKPIARILSAALAPPKYTEQKQTPQTITFVERAKPEPPRPEPEPARQFMETDNSQVTGEQPKNAKYYSDRSTVAANPANPTGKTGDTPYLEGKETRMMSTENVAPNLGARSAPVAPPAPVTPPVSPPTVAANSQTATEAKPSPSSPPPAPVAEQPKQVADKGLNAPEEKQLAMLSPETARAPQTPQTEPSPPAQPQQYRAPSTGSPGTGSQREIAAAKSRHVEAGVTRIGIAAFNVEESPFGAYDKQLIRAVQSRWYALIDKYGIYERTGEVTITFDLYSDGTVGNVKHEPSSAGELLAWFCEKAITDSAPFEPLPEKLQVLVGEKPREVNFTFYY